ncbi:hypothetical protein SMC26_39470 [Actinomadura fulvescens]
MRKTNDSLGKVAEELARVAALLADTRDEQTDHEARIRAVERWKYGVPLSAVMGLLSIIATVTLGLSRVSGKQ